MMTRNSPCPCCGFTVFSEPPGSYQFCPVCRWEDDHVQLSDPRFSGGANARSLWESQQEVLAEFPPDRTRIEGFARTPGWRPLRLEDLLAQFDPRSEVFQYYWEDEARGVLTGGKLS